VTPRAPATALLGVLTVLVLPLSSGVSYGVRLVTAVAAAVLLVRLGQALGTWSRALLAAALLVGIASGLVATVHLLVTGSPSPPGGAADWTYLSYGPLAVAGLLALPRHPQDGPWRAKALAEAAVVVASLGFVMSGLLEEQLSASGQTALAKSAAVGYSVNAVFVLSVLLVTVPRLPAELRPFLRICGIGFTLLLVGDVGYSAGTLHGWYTPTAWPAIATQAGLVIVAMSPSRARSRVHLVAHDVTVPSLLESAAPYLSIVPGIAYSCYLLGRGERFSLAEMALTIVIGVSLVARQLLSNADHQRALHLAFDRERAAQAAALRDPLTQLSNRTALLAELHRLLGGPAVAPVALALLDLDDFKDVNDTHGHETGDAILGEVARRLRGTAPPGALVARLGGDEFAVCTTGTTAAALAGSLVAALDEPVVLGTRRFTVTASIGVVIAGADDGTAAATARVALSHVDVAMYEAKARKNPQRSAVVVLDGQARAQAAARVQLREDVSHPDLSGFRVVYEPVVDLRDGAVVGAETLLRWHHPVLGEIGPTVFIPLAEQVGAIHALGEHALRSAVDAMADWLAAAAETGTPLDRAIIGVNLSPRQLGHPGLVDLVREVLAGRALPPYRLMLEITEEALLDDWDTAVDVIAGLRELGVGVAVDDFGTGYSSLRYLRRFDTSTVKVDREFVQAVADEPRTRALVASVIDMARTLGLVTVAEGIETLDQLAVLRALGCRYAQGYLFDRPMERDAFGALLLQRHRYPMGALGVPLPRAEAATDTALPVIPRRTG
jgi:diguanylate cyclase (GGDEF)-like protein